MCRAAQGSAGSVADTRESVMARGPTGFTTVLTGETAMSAGAMLRPCSSTASLRGLLFSALLHVSQSMSTERPVSCTVDRYKSDVTA